ncbi:LysR family transcriptional regulator [Sandaracinus amylolyticus]|uniref:Transcriptional regulator, LysR family protein n=1 Tax=Sandaracinus amylolyticus TaxID=927083 RepID=A0A0F6SEN5_9BACT|nr:LysR family transcriptional regulator [Sandaracinus amylolyticus]AKF05504.1 Transcriptional regulator, LysR family protein [Sandaracinus amylolyticus]
MIDPITLDQLRAFVTIADEGSFSAAARKLRRVQSAISHAIATLEDQLGLELFDRSARLPKLTEQGRLVLAHARRVLASAEDLRTLAQGLVGGLEPSVGLAVDAIFPTDALANACREFAGTYPTVPLRIHTETLSAVSALVLDGTCQLGVVGPDAPAVGLERHHLTTVLMIPVVAPSHPLAREKSRITTKRLAEHVQIVTSERTREGMPDRAVLSPLTWRVADLHTKHALLRAGLGWGRLPGHVAAEDLERGTLVRVRPEAWGDTDHQLALAAVHRQDTPLGPAATWLIERLGQLCRESLPPSAPANKRSSRRKASLRARA